MRALEALERLDARGVAANSVYGEIVEMDEVEFAREYERIREIDRALEERRPAFRIPVRSERDADRLAGRPETDEGPKLPPESPASESSHPCLDQSKSKLVRGQEPIFTVDDEEPDLPELHGVEPDPRPRPSAPDSARGK